MPRVILSWGFQGSGLTAIIGVSSFEPCKAIELNSFQWVFVQFFSGLFHCPGWRVNLWVSLNVIPVGTTHINRATPTTISQNCQSKPGTHPLHNLLLTWTIFLFPIVIQSIPWWNLQKIENYGETFHASLEKQIKWKEQAKSLALLTLLIALFWYSCKNWFAKIMAQFQQFKHLLFKRYTFVATQCSESQNRTQENHVNYDKITPTFYHGISGKERPWVSWVFVFLQKVPWIAWSRDICV